MANMSLINDDIHLNEWDECKKNYKSEKGALCFPQILNTIDQDSSIAIFSPTAHKNLKFHNQYFTAKLIRDFKESIDNRNCDINVLNALEYAINEGINYEEFQLLHCEFNKIFLVHIWPVNWYSRVLANAIFLSAFFRDSNLAISLSNCFRTFILLDQFYSYSDVIFNSISNSLSIVGETWDFCVYESIIEFSFAFMHAGTDSLWNLVSNIIYIISPRIGLDVLCKLSSEDMGIMYYFDGLTISRKTIAIFACVKGVIDDFVKSITVQYSDCFVSKVRQCITDLLSDIIGNLPKCDRFIEDLCKMAEIPENIIAVHILKYYIKSWRDFKLLTTMQFVTIGQWSINCSKAIYSRWKSSICQLQSKSDCENDTVEEINEFCTSYSKTSSKLKEILEKVSNFNLSVLCQMELLDLTNYQPHVWASLIFIDQHNTHQSFFENTLFYLKFCFSKMRENKYFSIPGPSIVLFSLISDVPKMIIECLSSNEMGIEEHLIIVSGLQKFMTLDCSLIDGTVFTLLGRFSGHKDYKVRLKVAQTLHLCLESEKIGHLIDKIALKLITDKSASVRLSAIKALDYILPDARYIKRLDIIKHLAHVYVTDGNQSVCQVALECLANFFLSRFIEVYDEYSPRDIVRILLYDLQGRKALISYYTGLDFRQNPIILMDKAVKGYCSENIFDFWYNYLLQNINMHNNIEFLYALHLFSDAFHQYFCTKIHELALLIKKLHMNDQTYCLLTELICKNLNGCDYDKLKGIIVDFINYGINNTSNAIIQAKMKLSVLCNLDVKSAINSGLNAIGALSLALGRTRELPTVNQNVKISIWNVGSILEYWPRISIVTDSICYKSEGANKVSSDLVEIGMKCIGKDANLLIIVICSLCSFISHFDNIQHLDKIRLVKLMESALYSTQIAANAVLIMIRKFYSLYFISKYYKHADELASMLASLVQKNVNYLLFTLDQQVQRRECLVILHGLIRNNSIRSKPLASQVFACYILYSNTRDVCNDILQNAELGFVTEYLEEGLEILVSNAVDVVGDYGQNVAQVSMPFKKLYFGNRKSENDGRNFVKLVRNKLESAASSHNFKSNLSGRERILFVDMLVAFIILICEMPVMEVYLFEKEVKMLVSRHFGDRGDAGCLDSFKKYVYKRLACLVSTFTLISNGGLARDVQAKLAREENERIRLFKKCL